MPLPEYSLAPSLYCKIARQLLSFSVFSQTLNIGVALSFRKHMIEHHIALVCSLPPSFFLGNFLLSKFEVNLEFYQNLQTRIGNLGFAQVSSTDVSYVL